MKHGKIGLVKASYLQPKSADRVQNAFTNNQVQKEYLGKIGGLRLLGIYKSISPKAGDVKKMIFGNATKEKKKKVKKETTVRKSENNPETFKSISTGLVRSFSPCPQPPASNPDNSNTLPIVQLKASGNFLFRYNPTKPKSIIPKRLIIVGNSSDSYRNRNLNSFQSLPNLSKITLDSSILPQGEETKIEDMINFAEFRSKLRSPFR